jgi:hypothetical protein
VLESLIENKLIIAAAKQHDMVVEEAEIEARVEDRVQQLVAQYGAWRRWSRRWRPPD